MTKNNIFKASILAGAIGDAWGSAYENFKPAVENDTFYPFGKPEKIIPQGQITDDTQLTLAQSKPC